MRREQIWFALGAGILTGMAAIVLWLLVTERALARLGWTNTLVVIAGLLSVIASVHHKLVRNMTHWTARILGLLPTGLLPDAMKQSCSKPASRGLLAIMSAALLVIPLMLFVLPADAANPAPVQIFYTPGKEAQLLPLLNQTSGNGAPVSPMHGVLSMVATRDGTLIYYDHWEDGFEADIANPVQSTSLVLGDGIAANGCAGTYFPTPVSPCNDGDDVINAGDILNQQEDNIVIPRDPATVLWDGGDKVGASKTIAMTRTSWADGSDTLMADSTEVYDTTFYGTHFTLPVGEAPLFSNELFENTVPMVMASEDNTTIQLDYDGNGTTDASTTLNEGQSFAAPLSAVILAGGTITADKPVQVQLMTGDDGKNYAFDGFTLFPTARWSDSYYTPVSRTCDSTYDTVGAEDSHVWLHNPNDTSITINYQDTTSSGTITLLPGETKPYTTTNSSGTNPSGSHFYTTDGSPFGALGTMDSDLNSGASNSAWDWGYTLVPETSLSTAAIVGWGPGQDPTITPYTENGNPVWVTPVGSFAGTKTVYVDFDGDPTTGANTDPNGHKYDVSYNLSALQAQIVYDTVNGDLDQTGTKVYTVDGTLIAVAWGQDVCTASAGAPGLDVGTTVLPLAALDFTKESALYTDVNGNGVVDAGDTLLYTLTVVNVSNNAANAPVLEDTPDDNTAYVLNSTERDGSPITDDGTGTLFPLDEGGYSVDTLNPGDSTVITFQVTIDDPLPDGVESVTNNALVSSSSGTTPARVTTPVRIPAFEVTKASETEHYPAQPGDTITYTIQAKNTSDTIQTGITVSDTVPAGTTYVAGSTLINAPSQPVRATEYYIGGGDGFDGTTYDLVLDRDLVSDYFVIIQGAGTLPDTGPDENYVRLTQDPFGTGDLGVSTASNVIRLERASAASTWIGVVTVVESVTDQATEGFNLLDVQAVAHTGTATAGTDTSGTAWSDVNDVVLFGGFNGAGCTTAEPDPGDIGNCQTRLYPSGTNTINWTRDADNVNDVLTDATSTVMVVEWGSSWTVQHVYVTGSAGGDKVDELNEYNTAAISPVARDNTWVWGTGTTRGTNQLKRNPEGIVITLGDGVNQNATESSVAVGSYNGIDRDFDVYVMTHPDLAVDYRFKPDGDRDFAAVDVTVDAANPNRMALAYTGNNAGNDETPAHLFSARYVNATTVRLEQQRTSDDWAVWVQGIDFADIVGPTTGIAGGTPPTLASGYTLEPGQSMVVTFQVTVNADPGTDLIVNTVNVTSDQDPGPNEATVSDPVGSVIGDYIWYDLDGDGVKDAGEAGIAGVTVELQDGTCTLGSDCPTAVTDANGNYQFIVGTDTGTFTVDVDETTLPAGLTQTYEKDGTPYDGQVDVTISTVGTVVDDVDFGYQPSGTISGTIYDDKDPDGSNNNADTPLEWVEVGLYYADGTTPVLDSAGNPLVVTTDENGFYEFTNLPGDDYVIVVDPDGDTLPGLAVNWEDPDGTNPPTDSDGRAAVTLAAGGGVAGQDFGYNVPDYLIKAVSATNASPGDTLTYTTTVNYAGNDLFTNLQVTDAIPAGTTYVADSDTPEATITPADDDTATLITWDLGSNAAGTDGSAPGTVMCPAFDTIVADADTHIWGNNPDGNSGGSAKLNADSDDPRHMLLHFDLSSLPADAIIDDARLQVTVESGQNADRTVSVRELTYGPWTEGTGGEGGDTCSTGATWNAPNCTDISTGWDGAGADFGTAAPYGSALGSISPAVDEATYSMDVTSVVSAWYAGTATNYGFALLADGSDTGTVKFHSRTGVAGKEPALVVTYRYPSATDCTPTVRDEFTTELYSNNDGTTTWSGDWVESDYNDGTGSPTAGDIRVTSGYLSFKTEKDAPAQGVQSIYRETDLSGGVAAATLSYNLLQNGLDANETVLVQASNNGGGAWTTLQTIVQGTATGAQSFDLLAALGSVSSQTRVRVVQTAADSDGKELRFDDMQIAWTLPAPAGGTTSLGASPTLVTDGDTITVTMTVSSTEEMTNITPTTPTLSATTGGASCTGLAGDETPQSIGAGGGSVTFTWTCTASAGTTLPSNVQFQNSATATDSNGQPAIFSTSTSNSVLVAPPLTFRVTVDSPATLSQVDNTSYIDDDAIIDNPIPSNEVSTDINVTIGDRVWLDEGGDGEQDAGEAGIANVKVELKDGLGNVVATTYTDADGNYLFTGVKAGDYTVVVTPPAGLNPTYDEDGIGTANQTDVSVSGGVEYDTADFGYNWVPPTDSTNPDPGATGAIGDRVWIDADGDGVQDPGEPGLGDVSVKLYNDPDGDGIYDNLVATTTTAPDGSYIFDGLAPDDYVVVVNDGTAPTGYTQTGDPDGTLDNQSDPIVLAPGDVYVNADFGYEPDAGTTGTIGDTVWLDADRNELQDPGEPGIAGVTVALIEDSNGNGVWDAGEPIIATDVTDANGQYEFVGLPVTDGAGTDDYLVWVNDTDNVLGDLVPTDDADAVDADPATGVVTGLGISVVQDLTTTPVTDQDFAYAPEGHDAGEGLIGDTIYLDTGDGAGGAKNGSPDPGEGLEGVTVNLYASDGTTLLAMTTTDENGNYTFGGLDPDATYVVQVDTTTLPNGGAGLTNTIDPDGGTADQSTVTLTAGSPINLDQDFGYTADAPGTVDGTIWNDTDADGTVDAGETGRYAGVTVALLDSNGNVVATTTDANGYYSFPNVAPGNYTVDVTDENNVLDGTWHSEGTDSEPDPAPVTVTGGATTNADFGYYSEPASLGDYVWEDTNGDGIQDTGEPGIPGVKVTLEITYPSGDVVTVVTTTDENGFYSFDNLLLDESFDGAGAGEPTYEISVTPPIGYVPTRLNKGDGTNDSDDPAGVPATATQGALNDVYDFGFREANAAAGDLVWLDVDGDGVQDVGEPGLANVTVNLYDSGNNLIATTRTDANGEYLFESVVPGTGYTVDLDETTLPSGLTAAPGTGDTSGPFDLAAGESYLDADFGYTNADTTKALIGDTVWSDADGDGVQDPGEPGIGGVTATIYYDSNGDGIVQPGVDSPYTDAVDQDDNTGTGTTTTEADGSYLFSNLPPGEYVVQLSDGTGTPLEGYSPTSGPQSEGSDTSDPIAVAAGDVYLNADFGYQNSTLYSISDRVWLDQDSDGTPDAGELGIEGVTVNLLNAAGNVVATTTTDANGDFTFDGLLAGDYTIEIADTGNELGGLGGTTAPATAGSQAVTVIDADVSGENFGYSRPGSIGDTVFVDSNGNGIQDAGEPGIGGVTLDLYEDSNQNGVFDPAVDTLLGTTTTADDGSYLFTSSNVSTPLADATYFVDVTDTGGVLVGYTLSPGTPDDQTATDGTQHTVSLGAAEHYPDADFGYQQPALADVSGSVWNDLDADGMDDGAGEPPIAGVTVALLDENGNVIGTAVTDTNGDYTFWDVPAGNYTVAVTDEDGVLEGYDLTSGLDEIPVTVVGTDIDNIDFGYVRDPQTASIGDFIWMDADRDGVQDAAEAGIAGVTVELKANETIVIDGVTYNAGDTIATTETDATGHYLFDDLPAGNYYVDVDGTTLPAGLAPTTGTTDPSGVINLSEGEAYLDADFGYTSSTGSALGDRVWYDADGDGVQDPGEAGIGSVQVQVTPPAGVDLGNGAGQPVVVTTDPDGSWLLTGVPAGDYTVEVLTASLPAGYNTAPTNGAISRTLKVSSGKDALYGDFGFAGGTTGAIGDTIYLDANTNGTQDGGEVGIEGITVNLVDDSGNVIATTTTGASGDYQFVGVSDGTYIVEVTDLNNILSDLNQTEDQDATLDGSTSVVLSDGSVTSIGGTSCTGCDNSVDFGYAPAGGTIGNLVWHDLNGDGVRDAGEPGTEGITVDLWLDMNGDGDIDPGIDNLLRTVTTDENGEYEFKGLPPRNYLVDVTDESGVLAGFTKTSGTPGADDNSQADPYAVTLTAGAPSDYTADFGYQAGGTPHSISGVVFEDKGNDGTFQDGTDPRASGIEVLLFRDLDGDGVLDADDPLIGTTLTDANGTYSFTDLPDGDYIVTTNATGSKLDGMFQTTQTTTAAVQPVTLSGADSTNNNFGFYVPQGFPTAVSLAAFDAAVQEGAVIITWSTSSELDNMGFNLYRGTSPDGPDMQLNRELIPSQSPGTMAGASYEFVDTQVKSDVITVYYWLEDVDFEGVATRHGPLVVRLLVVEN